MTSGGRTSRSWEKISRRRWRSPLPTLAAHCSSEPSSGDARDSTPTIQTTEARPMVGGGLVSRLRRGRRSFLDGGVCGTRRRGQEVPTRHLGQRPCQLTRKTPSEKNVILPGSQFVRRRGEAISKRA